MTGISEFLKGMERFTSCSEYPEAFGARVFKITRDDKGGRLTHMKLTGGTLSVKEIVG